jgi:hypothetical protein
MWSRIHAATLNLCPSEKEGDMRQLPYNRVVDRKERPDRLDRVLNIIWYVLVFGAIFLSAFIIKR